MHYFSLILFLLKKNAKALCVLIIVCLLGLFAAGHTSAQQTPHNYSTVINLVRGKHRWISQEDWLSKQAAILHQLNLPSTWLLDYDALSDASITEKVKSYRSDSFGLFLEVTPTLAQQLDLPYDYSSLPHKPHNAFVSGYTIDQKQDIIDYLVHTHESTLGTKPVAAGAWFIDSWSLNYLREAHGITSILLVAEQYGTDHHTIRGHPWQAPYYPSSNNSLVPARPGEETGTVVVQWAVREPLRGYGFYREFSNYSVQANDYTQQGLDVTYFRQLLDTYTLNSNNEVNQVTLGIEVGQEGAEYYEEFKTQMELAKAQSLITFMTLPEFTEQFRSLVKENSPVRVATWEADNAWAGWITTPYYRVGLVADEGKLIVRDFRVYDHRQDDFFSLADRRHDLFRQAQPIIDQVGLNSQWVLHEQLATTSAQVIRNSADSVTIAFGEMSLQFRPDHILTNQELIDVPQSISFNKNESEYIIKPETPTHGNVTNRFLPYLILLSLLLLSLSYVFYRRLQLIRCIIPIFWLTLLLFIPVVLTPVQDLGIGYLLYHSTWFKWLSFVITPLGIAALSVGLFQRIYNKTHSLILALLGQWLLFANTSLGWLFPLYRKLPLNPELITGTYSIGMPFSWAIDIGNLSRLGYAFSAGQMHIGFFSNLLAKNPWLPWNVLPAAGFFLVMNLGILSLGLGYFVWKLFKQKKYIQLTAVVALTLISLTTTNTIDVRFPSVFDWLVKLISIVGFIELIKSLKPKLAVVVFVSVMALSLTLPQLLGLINKNKQHIFRLETNWSDRALTVSHLQSVENLTDVFHSNFSTEVETLFVPMGVQDSLFIDPIELKQDQTVLWENSYGIGLKLDK